LTPKEAKEQKPQLEKGLVSITVSTNFGDASVNVIENEVTKLSARPESEALYYEMATTEGYYNVTVEVYKAGYTTVTLYSSYRVRAESLYVQSYSGVRWVSDTFVQIIIHTNWGNCTIRVTENTGGDDTTVYTGATEGTIRWTGNQIARTVNVTLTIDGGADSLTWEDSYHFVKKEDVSTALIKKITGLQPRDLILPAFTLICTLQRIRIYLVP